MAQRTQTSVRLAGGGAGLAGAWLVRGILDAAWRRAVGHTTPAADDEDRSLAEVAAATLLTSALVALVRLLATRGAARALTPRRSRAPRAASAQAGDGTTS
jgi:hypothetical protein